MPVETVEAFLRQSYWAAERSRERISRTLETSLCFMAFDERDRRAVGFARVVTDYADFAWLCDVFVEPDARGNGLGKWLVECVLEHPELQGLRRMILATSSAHGLYERYGFTPLANPERWMERSHR
jgi:GNAT superfamily N-acetyltransferase